MHPTSLFETVTESLLMNDSLKQKSITITHEQSEEMAVHCPLTGIQLIEFDSSGAPKVAHVTETLMFVFESCKGDFLYLSPWLKKSIDERREDYDVPEIDSKELFDHEVMFQYMSFLKGSQFLLIVKVKTEYERHKSVIIGIDLDGKC